MRVRECACAVGGQPQQSTIVVNVPTVQLGNTAGSYPVQTFCPTCHQSVVTNVSYEIGGLTWLIAGILCIIGSVQLLPPARRRLQKYLGLGGNYSYNF